jgi:DNA-binding Lrp family transcriptional regulator
MAKNSKKKIEADKKSVLMELGKNSSDSINVIAKRLGFSRQKVWRIIKDLEDSNTIWGYTAVFDDEKIGRKRFFVLLKRSSKPASEGKINIVVKRELREVATELGVELEGSYYIYGVYDWLMCITADSINQVKRFCDSFSTVFKGTYVSDIHILEVMFPIGRNGFDNPNLEGFKKFF